MFNPWIFPVHSNRNDLIFCFQYEVLTVPKEIGTMQFPPMSNNIVSWGKTECQRGHSQIEVGTRGPKEPSLICNFELHSHFVFCGCDRAAIRNPVLCAVDRSPERHPFDLISELFDIDCPPMELRECSVFSLVYLPFCLFMDIISQPPSHSPSPASWHITPMTPSQPHPQTSNVGPSCYWHLVANTGDLFKFVHLRTPSGVTAGGHWSMCGLQAGGLLVTSPLGFKARVGSLIHTWQRCMCYIFSKIHLWCNTCQPLGGLHGSWANLFHVPASRHWWGLKTGPIALQANVLPTELCRLGYIYSLVNLN